MPLIKLVTVTATIYGHLLHLASALQLTYVNWLYLILSNPGVPPLSLFTNKETEAQKS